MNWKTTITAQGLAILAGLDDNRVTIVSAWTGTGTVPPETLQDQTALQDPKQKLLIAEDGKVGNRRTLRLQLTNSELNTGYTLHQLGIYVSVDGGEPILYFIAQNTLGDAIPAKDTAAGFLAEYTTTLIFSMRSEVVLEQPETVFVTHDALDAKVTLLAANLIIISPTQPPAQPPGGLWLDTSDGPASIGESGIAVGNAIVSDTDPVKQTEYDLWFNTVST